MSPALTIPRGLTRADCVEMGTALWMEEEASRAYFREVRGHGDQKPRSTPSDERLFRIGLDHLRERIKSDSFMSEMNRRRAERERTNRKMMGKIQKKAVTP